MPVSHLQRPIAIYWLHNKISASCKRALRIGVGTHSPSLNEGEQVIHAVTTQPSDLDDREVVLMGAFPYG